MKLFERFLLSVVLLGLMGSFAVKRGLSKLTFPRIQTESKPDTNGFSVYDTVVPDLKQLGPRNAWRLMWEHVPEGSRVLDVGCSTGSLGFWLRTTRNCIVTGVDAFANDLKVVSLRLDETYLRDVDSLVWTDGMAQSFDVVLMMDVLEHLRTPEATLQAARTGLKPDGLVVVNVPNIVNWRIRFEMLRGRWEY